jgi:serpin B
MQSFSTSDVRLALPKFKITFSAKLNEALSAMGMQDAFSESKADFSQMIKQRPAWISRVLQKTFLDVNEEGTEAAAVTAVVMATRSVMMRPEPVVEFRVDRPFVAAIVDNQSKEILFLGTVKDP